MGVGQAELQKLVGEGFSSRERGARRQYLLDRWQVSVAIHLEHRCKSWTAHVRLFKFRPPLAKESSGNTMDLLFFFLRASLAVWVEGPILECGPTSRVSRIGLIAESLIIHEVPHTCWPSITAYRVPRYSGITPRYMCG